MGGPGFLSGGPCANPGHYTTRLGVLVRRSDDAREIGPLVLVSGMMRWLTGFLVWYGMGRVGDPRFALHEVLGLRMMRVGG